MKSIVKKHFSRYAELLQPGDPIEVASARERRALIQGGYIYATGETPVKPAPAPKTAKRPDEDDRADRDPNRKKA